MKLEAFDIYQEELIEDLFEAVEGFEWKGTLSEYSEKVGSLANSTGLVSYEGREMSAVPQPRDDEDFSQRRERVTDDVSYSDSLLGSASRRKSRTVPSPESQERSSHSRNEKSIKSTPSAKANDILVSAVNEMLMSSENSREEPSASYAGTTLDEITMDSRDFVTVGTPVQSTSYESLKDENMQTHSYGDDQPNLESATEDFTLHSSPSNPIVLLASEEENTLDEKQAVESEIGQSMPTQTSTLVDEQEQVESVRSATDVDVKATMDSQEKDSEETVTSDIRAISPTVPTDPPVEEETTENVVEESSERKLEPEPSMGSEAESAMSRELESEVEASPEPEAEPEAELNAEPEAELTAEPEAELKAEPEAELKESPESVTELKRMATPEVFAIVPSVSSSAETQPEEGKSTKEADTVEVVLYHTPDVDELKAENSELRAKIEYLQKVSAEKEMYYAELAWYGRRTPDEIKATHPLYWEERKKQFSKKVFQQFLLDTQIMADREVGDWQHGFSSGCLATSRLLLGLSTVDDKETNGLTVEQQRKRHMKDFPSIEP